MEPSAMELLYKLHAYAYNPSINIPNPYVDQSALETSKPSNDFDNLKPKKDTKRRSQVKIACIHCKKACKKCDNARPCSRCIRTGTASTCVDAPRKERKKDKKTDSFGMPEILAPYDQSVVVNSSYYSSCIS